MFVVLPFLAIAVVFAFIKAHSALFPIPEKKKSAAAEYGEAFEKLLKEVKKD